MGMQFSQKQNPYCSGQVPAGSAGKWNAIQEDIPWEGGETAGRRKNNQQIRWHGSRVSNTNT